MACMREEHRQYSLHTNYFPTTAKGAVIHSDVCEKISNTSPCSSCYYASFPDEARRYLTAVYIERRERSRHASREITHGWKGDLMTKLKYYVPTMAESMQL